VSEDVVLCLVAVLVQQRQWSMTPCSVLTAKWQQLTVSTEADVWLTASVSHHAGT